MIFISVMDSLWPAPILILFAAIIVGSYAENITLAGSASSLFAAKQMCSQYGEMLITAGSNESMRNIKNYLDTNNLTRAWLHATLEELPQWRFTDENETLLEDQIDTTNGGSCGALSSGVKPTFKSFPCRSSFQALAHNDTRVLFYGKPFLKWHSLNKTKLATPTRDSFEKVTKLFDNQREVRAKLEPHYWVGLHKFRFTWPDGNQIPFREYVWEDDSTKDGECLVLKDNGNLIVVDCNNENNYTVLCIPSNADPRLSHLFIIAALSVTGALILVIITISFFRVSKKRTQAYNPNKNRKYHT